MKFDQIYKSLSEYQSKDGQRLTFLILKRTMEDIYNCIVNSGAMDCLELGTGHGATTCIIAAALDELGEGKVSTVDMFHREPIGIDQLAGHTGLNRYIDVHVDQAGYNWYLAEVLRRQCHGKGFKPCFDFCFLDGAHEWGPDALAASLITRLLYPGAWLVLDDLDFRLRGCQLGWESTFAGRSDGELDARQVQMVFDLVVRRDPQLSEFVLTDAGRTGWARKVGGPPAAWRPVGQVLEDVEETDDARWIAPTDLVGKLQPSPQLTMQNNAGGLLLTKAERDPWVAVYLDNPRPIHLVRVRFRILASNSEETAQVFWAAVEDEWFAEERSLRIPIDPSDQVQELTVRLNSSNKPPMLKGVRFDFTDGPSSIIWSGLMLV